MHNRTSFPLPPTFETSAQQIILSSVTSCEQDLSLFYIYIFFFHEVVRLFSEEKKNQNKRKQQQAKEEKKTI